MDLGQLADRVGKPENLAVGQRIAEEAITLVRDNGQVLPLRQALPRSRTSSGTMEAALPYQSLTETHNRLVAVIFSDDLRTESGRMFERQDSGAGAGCARIIYVDPRSAAGMKATVAEAVEAAEHVVAGACM